MKLPLEPCVTLMGWSPDRVYEPVVPVRVQPAQLYQAHPCPVCGRRVPQRAHTRSRVYCTDRCRNNAAAAMKRERRRDLGEVAS